MMTESLTQKYEALLAKSFDQVADLQCKLDEAILNDSLHTTALTGGIKQLASVIADFTRQKELAEVGEKSKIPVEVLEVYHTEFFPKILQGLEELKKRIEADLPSDFVPSFVAAWQRNLRFYNDAVQEAIQFIESGKLVKKGQEIMIKDIMSRRNNKVNDVTRKLKKEALEEEA